MIFPSFVAFSAQIDGVELFMTCQPNKNLSYLEFRPTAEVPSLIARFAVEPVGDSDLVHIRSCYKNKYLCRTTLSSYYIVASGDKPVEDKKAIDCTLFRVKNLGSQVMTFTHIQSGYDVAFPNDIKAMSQYVLIGQEALRLQIVDYGGFAKFPKRVIFKGNNGQYLRCRLQAPFPIPIAGGFWGPGAVVEEKHEYNEFTSSDGSDRSAHYEITQYNGMIRIKSLQFGKFLRRNNDKNYNSWIWGDSNDTTINNYDTLFTVENLGNNVIALRNVGNNKVCRRLSADRLKNCLKAMETYVVPEARLIVEEPVSSRTIKAKYKLEDAKITSKKLIHYSTATGVNRYKDRDDQLSDSFKYKKTRTTKWDITTTITKSVNVEINLPIPKYIDGKIHLSDQIVEVTRLGNRSIFSEEREARYSIKVPPMTKAILKGYVHEVTYDIPYGYIQTDVFTTGEKDITLIEDGVCQGVEAYDYHYEKEYIPI